MKFEITKMKKATKELIVLAIFSCLASFFPKVLSILFIIFGILLVASMIAIIFLFIAYLIVSIFA